MNAESLISQMQSTASSPMPSSVLQSWANPANSSASSPVSLMNSTKKNHWKLSFFLEPNSTAWEERHRLKPRLPRGWARRVQHSHGYVKLEGCGCNRVEAGLMSLKP